MADQWIYFFESGSAEGNGQMKDLLGGKGAGLAEMCRLGVPVPPGFTITTEVCRYYLAHRGGYPRGMKGAVREAVARIETLMERSFGDPRHPLLISVRSGARASMPGMMDTILNIGLNDRTVAGLADSAGGDERFAWDSYRRLIQMYGEVVMGVPAERFERIITRARKKAAVTDDAELPAEAWKQITAEFTRFIEKHTGDPFPTDPWEQLWGAIGAVFGSWNTPRAVTYRDLNDIPHDLGTAANVQAMVFGNLGKDSATGVGFTRNPSTGENRFYGEWLPRAQGEDVVAGIRTPRPINSRQESELPSLETHMPEVYRQLDRVRVTLEAHYRDMQDLEFTIEQGRLWLLQTRTGKRTAQAALRIAVEMVQEGLLSEQEAIVRVDARQLDHLLHPSFRGEAKRRVLATGLPASPGAAVGQVVFTAAAAEEWADEGRRVILVREETSPDDIGGMSVAVGILTARGGMTSHAAVVARGMGRCCVAGCEAIEIDETRSRFRIGRKTIEEGDWISLDGSSGEVMEGKVPTTDPELSREYHTLMKWADRTRSLKVRTNADTPADAVQARRFGAEGIGLCRTEHMFFEGDRLKRMREVILADNEPERRRALKKLLPIQRADFEGIFKAMDGLPVTIRLLDPPLHEFLPHTEEAIRSVADEFGARLERVRRRAASLAEFNPMLGHRGCRLGLTYPEIYEMQAEAILEAACRVAARGGKVLPEIMIPLVGTEREFTMLKELIDQTAERVMARHDKKVPYLVGTMIEIPRACLVAEAIARQAAFFSFGTNDLTQMGFGFSRDDAGRFLPLYVERQIVAADPFQKLDVEGIGELVSMAVERGRRGRPDLKTGICGEHGGDPESIAFFQKVGLDYVSCSPYRVPIARLAAAQAVLNQQEPLEHEPDPLKARARQAGSPRSRARGKGARRRGIPPRKV